MTTSHVRTSGRKTVAPAAPLQLLDDLRTLVTVCRTHERDIQIRQLYARIDRGPRVTLLYGESFTL